MALKSVVSVDVDDSSFQRFAAMFAKYQEQLNRTPDAWKKVGDEVETALDMTVSGVEDVETATDKVVTAAERTSVAFRQTFININGQAGIIERVARTQRDTGRAVEAQTRSWRDMARSAHSFAGQIAGATQSLLRWGALSGVIAGIVGGGGLFGIDRLATSAGNSRRSALGLGVSVGEQKAFETNYGRFGDAGALLGNVNTGLTDVTSQQRLGLYGAGLTDRDLAGKDSAQVAVLFTNAVKKLVDATPDALLGSTLRSLNIDSLISPGEANTLKHSTPAEIAAAGQRFQHDATTLNTPDATGLAWRNLQDTLTRAAQTIETMFINKLVSLAEPIEHLSKGFVDLVAAVMASAPIKGWIDTLAAGIESFAKAIATDRFKADVLSFVDQVAALGSKAGQFVADVAEMVGGLDHAIKVISGWWNAPLDPAGTGGAQPDGSTAPTGPGGAYTPTPGEVPWWKKAYDGWFGAPSATPPSSFVPANGSGFVPAAYHAGDGPSPALMDAVWQAESGRGKHLVSSAGAVGDFQFTKGTWDQYGRGANPFDPAASRDAAQRYFTDLLKEFHGIQAQALAAYNAGPGTVEKDLRDYGNDWRAHLPKETQSYLNQILPKLGGQPAQGGGSVTVTMQNNTGGNTIASVSQVAI